VAIVVAVTSFGREVSKEGHLENKCRRIRFHVSLKHENMYDSVRISTFINVYGQWIRFADPRSNKKCGSSGHSDRLRPFWDRGKLPLLGLKMDCTLMKNSQRSMMVLCNPVTG
jgi:hypothetical protein